MGYHEAKIKRGVFGEASKIREEWEEFEDARAQGCKLMVLQELSDLVGAIEGYLKTHYPGFALRDLIQMAEITERAFVDGERNPRGEK